MSDIVVSTPLPLERLSVPENLDGRDGTNRASFNTVKQIAAENDLQAVEAWLAEFTDSPQTLRHYRKDAERLLLWCLLERQKPLSSISREDCLLYDDFLANPSPAERWCGPKAPRYSPHWKPFVGPLSDASRRTALLVINSLFSYLVKAGYLSGNPLALIKRRGRKVQQPRQTVERYLEHDQWQILLNTVTDLPRQSLREQRHYERTRYLVSFLYLLGPRVHEIANHNMGSFVEIRGRWWWMVTGKGAKEARVPINQDMVLAMQRYRQFYSLSPMPEPEDPTPLVMSLNGTSGITDNMIYRIIKDLVSRAADKMEIVDAYKAAKLRQASTHWFRHTSITHQADVGISLSHLQRNARHAKLETTALYMHTEDSEWHEAMEQHRFKKEPGD